MNVPDSVANEIKRCVWILRTCLQMHSCIPLNPHPPEQNLIDGLMHHGHIISLSQ